MYSSKNNFLTRALAKMGRKTTKLCGSSIYLILKRFSSLRQVKDFFQNLTTSNFTKLTISLYIHRRIGLSSDFRV